MTTECQETLYFGGEWWVEFCNDFPCNITLPHPNPAVNRDVSFGTAEHYFQASKFAFSPVDFTEVISAKNPVDCIVLASEENRLIRPDWDIVKNEVMLQVLQAKFFQNPELGELLLWTEKKSLIFRSPDIYWGDGLNGKGKNYLGIVMTTVREMLQRKGDSNQKNDITKKYLIQGRLPDGVEPARYRGRIVKCRYCNTVLAKGEPFSEHNARCSMPPDSEELSVSLDRELHISLPMNSSSEEKIPEQKKKRNKKATCRHCKAVLRKDESFAEHNETCPFPPSTSTLS